MVNKANKINRIIGRYSAINISNSGGTEEIARYLNNIYECEISYEEKISLKNIMNLFKHKDSKVFLLGASKIFILKFLFSTLIFKCNPSVVYIKTTNKVNKKDLILRLLLLYVFKKVNVADLDGSYFQVFPSHRKMTINIPELVNVNLKSKNILDSCIKLNARDIDIGYIGRVDDEKGFFEVIEILQDIRLKDYKKLCDILIWDDKKDIQIINDIKNKNIPSLIFNTNFKSTNSLPNYQNIKAVILPYRNFNSTIRVPLVIFESLSAECLVFLPKWIMEDKEILKLINEFHNINKKEEKSLFFYDKRDDLIGLLEQELVNISEKTY